MEAISRADGGATWWVILEAFSTADGGVTWWVILEAFSRADGGVNAADMPQSHLYPINTSASEFRN